MFSSASDTGHNMNYSLKRVNNSGAVDEVLNISVGSDGLALAWGRLFSLGDEVEVWRDCRQLTTISSSGMYRPRKQSEVSAPWSERT